VKKSGLYRRSSAVFGKERAMDIDTEFFGSLEDLDRKDTPIGNDDEVVTLMVS
jgi:hypothetical protein